MAECGTITIEDPTAKLEIVNCGFTPLLSAAPDERITITASVANNGTADLEGSVDFLVDGTVVASDTAVVESGQTVELSGSFVPQEEGVSGDVTISTELTNTTMAAPASHPTGREMTEIPVEAPRGGCLGCGSKVGRAFGRFGR